MRAGRVAIVGRTNVGKSTFLNAALELPLAITSPLPQTTREELLGVVRRPEAEIAFVDTPGLHRPKSELGRRMNAAAIGSLENDDAIVFMTEAGALGHKPKHVFLPDADPLHPDDRRLLQALPSGVPCVLVINKVDLLRDKSRLLPLMAAFSEAHEFASIIPVSVLAGDGVDRVLEEIERVLPEAEPRFDAETLTDRPMTYFAREYIREQVLARAGAEVPHAVAVTIDRFEQKPKLCVISATIHVERSGQGSILVGRGGQAIKAIGTGARERLEQLLGGKVHLELFVRVSERWKNTPRRLNELGYERSDGRSLQNLLPDNPGERRPRPPRKADAAATVPGKKPRAPARKPRSNGKAKPAGKPRLRKGKG